MVRIILKHNGICRIIYEGYDVEVGLYIKKTLTTLGWNYFEHIVKEGNMIYKYIETYRQT